MTTAVSYRRDGPVAWITIERPETRNALSGEVRATLTTRLHELAEDRDALVGVLTGRGDKAFCAGGDLKEMSTTTLRVPPRDFVPQVGRTIELDKPLIGAINGLAYAGGFMLAQNCDLLIAAEHARFAVTEVKVGRGVPWAVPLVDLVGSRTAMQLLLTGDPIDAHRAFELGLVNKVVAAEDLCHETQDWALRIAANAPLSVRAAKATVQLAERLPRDQAFTAADRIWEPVYLSQDAQEGPTAFAERRPPSWKGR